MFWDSFIQKKFRTFGSKNHVIEDDHQISSIIIWIKYFNLTKCFGWFYHLVLVAFFVSSRGRHNNNLVSEQTCFKYQHSQLMWQERTQIDIMVKKHGINYLISTIELQSQCTKRCQYFCSQYRTTNVQWGGTL